MTEWSIDIRTVATAQTPGPEVFFQRCFGEWVEIAIHVFVLQGGAGTIVIDTGFAANIDDLNQAMRARKGPQAGFDLQIANIWRALPELPVAVALTSFGPYAAGGLINLPAGIPLFASARGLADLAGPEEPALVHPLPETTRRVLLETAIPVHKSREILPGVVFHETGVHHPASAALEVLTSQGRIIIADPVFTARNLTGGIALGASENAASWFSMVRRLGQEGARFLPIHEPGPQPVELRFGPKGTWHASIMHDEREKQ